MTCVPLSDDDLDQAFRASPLFQELEQRVERDEPPQESQAKRHHFVPQFLLRKFANEDNRLFQLDVATGRPQGITPSSAASRRHFYAAVDDEGVRHARVEAFLATVESHAAPALKRFLAEPLALSAGNRATLALFFALFGTRTPHAADRTAAASNAAAQMMFGGRLTHPDVFARDYREAIGEGTPEEIEELRLSMIKALAEGRVQLKDPRAHAIGLGLQVSADLAALIYAATWTVLEAETFFVTSDTGLAMYDPSPAFPWSGNGWASSPDAETTIPLSTSHCLLITAGDNGRVTSRAAAAENVDAINLRTYGWASGYIYGHSLDAVAYVRRLAKRRREMVVRPQPPRQIVNLDPDPADNSLSDEHERRGWPRYVYADGVPHDYIVIDKGGDAVEAGVRASRLARERAERDHRSEQA
jgi:hypothetical protein